MLAPALISHGTRHSAMLIKHARLKLDKKRATETSWSTWAPVGTKSGALRKTSKRHEVNPNSAALDTASRTMHARITADVASFQDTK